MLCAAIALGSLALVAVGYRYGERRWIYLIGYGVLIPAMVLSPFALIVLSVALLFGIIPLLSFYGTLAGCIVGLVIGLLIACLPNDDSRITQRTRQRIVRATGAVCTLLLTGPALATVAAHDGSWVVTSSHPTYAKLALMGAAGVVGLPPGVFVGHWLTRNESSSVRRASGQKVE
jgi:hypothetical protein